MTRSEDDEKRLDPKAEARLRDRFSAQTAMDTIGARVSRVRLGEVEIELPAAPHIRQQQGFVHGGVIAMVLDSACGFAAFTVMPEGVEVVSVEFKINFLKPALGERFLARGRVLRAGRALTACQGEVYAVTNGREEAVAAMQATMAAVTPR
jgi:uncharacterized protein (TIGR00369 family)